MARRMFALTIALTKSLARRTPVPAVLLCWSCLTVCTPSARAQHGIWTFKSAEQTALEQSPRVRSAIAARDTANAYRTFGTLPRAGNPFVNMRAMIGYPDQSAATYSLTVGIPFDVAGKRRAWKREAGSIVAEAEARLAAAQNDVRAEVRSTYVQVAMAHAARVVAGQSADTAKELVQRVQAQLDVNAITALDLALSESQYADAVANLSRADRALVEAQNAFRQAMGLLYDVEVEVEPLPAPTLPESLTVSVAVERARAHRKETLAWANQAQRWRNADSRLRAEAWAPMTAGLEGEAQANRNTQHTIGAAVGVELPVVFRNQGERAVAKGEANSASVERELTEQAIDREASSSHRALQAALAELSVLEERALPAAERTLAMVHTMLEAGVVDYFRVLNARGGAFALRSRRVEALREAWLARIALERAMGGWESAP
jgi:cobalt-zinc-cadmium efflux system outer membrane protein